MPDILNLEQTPETKYSFDDFSKYLKSNLINYSLGGLLTVLGTKLLLNPINNKLKGINLASSVFKGESPFTFTPRDYLSLIGGTGSLAGSLVLQSRNFKDPITREPETLSPLIGLAGSLGGTLAAHKLLSGKSVLLPLLVGGLTGAGLRYVFDKNFDSIKSLL